MIAFQYLGVAYHLIVSISSDLAIPFTIPVLSSNKAFTITPTTIHERK